MGDVCVKNKEQAGSAKMNQLVCVLRHFLLVPLKNSAHNDACLLLKSESHAHTLSAPPFLCSLRHFLLRPSRSCNKIFAFPLILETDTEDVPSAAAIILSLSSLKVGCCIVAYICSVFFYCFQSLMPPRPSTDRLPVLDEIVPFLSPLGTPIPRLGAEAETQNTG